MVQVISIPLQADKSQGSGIGDLVDTMANGHGFEGPISRFCSNLREALPIESCHWVVLKGMEHYYQQVGLPLVLQQDVDDYAFPVDCVQIIPELELETDLPSSLKKNLSLKSGTTVMSIPVISPQNQKTYGLLLLSGASLGSWQDETHQSQINDLVVELEHVAMMMELYDNRLELETSLKRERLISRIVGRLSQTFNINEILQVASKEIGSFLGLDRCVVIQYDANSERIPIRYIGQYCRDHNIEPIKQEDIPEEIILQGLSSLLFLSEPEKDMVSVESEFRKDYGVRDSAYIQVVYRGMPLGMIMLHQCDSSRDWSSEEMALVNQIAIQLGAAIYQSELYRQEQRANETARFNALRKNQYLASMTHELRTPLHTIISCATMGEQEMLGPLTDKQREYFQLIHRGGDHLLQMINDLLDMAKIESNKFELKVSSLKSSAIFEDVEALMMPHFNSKEQTYELTLSQDFPESFSADGNRLKQVLINLLFNAHKFSDSKKTIQLKGKLNQSDGKGPTIEIQVLDEGCGIAHKNLKKIFEPFEQAECPRQTSKIKGTGLGLSISQHIIELHHGVIDVESQVERGSCFTIRIPFNP